MTPLTLVVPAIGAGILAWLIPQGLARVLPEGVRPLVLNGVLSSLAMLAIAMLYFYAAYRSADPGFTATLMGRPLAAAWALGKPALMSALVWLPIVVLSVAQLPSRWTEQTW